MSSSEKGGEHGSQELEMLAVVCGHLPSFIDKGQWRPVTRLENVVFRTVARGRGTYETVVDLIVNDKSLQAAMLSRSLFEDTAVAHWLVLHRDDPDWLLDRFDRHRDAMRLLAHESRSEFGWSEEPDDVSDILPKKDQLKHEFGRFAQKDWWGQDRHGNQVSMPQLVKRLADAEMFQPRLKGEAPILEQFYTFQHKAWTQALHHTAAGMELRFTEPDRFPVAIALPRPFLILAANYWVFGQLLFAAVELAAMGAYGYFQKLFLAGLAVFGASIDVDVPWAAEVEAWAEEDPKEM